MLLESVIYARKAGVDIKGAAACLDFGMELAQVLKLTKKDAS